MKTALQQKLENSNNFIKQFLFFITIAFLGNQSFAQAPTSGLVAYYNFENSLSSNAATHSLVKGNAALPNVPFVLGKYGQGVSFNGGQFLENGTMGTAITGVEYTVSFWLKKEPSVRLYESAYELFGSQYFRTESTTNKFGIAVGPTTFANLDADLPNMNVWRHYAIMLKNNGSANALYIFIDGVLSPFSINLNSGSTHRFNNKITVGGGTNGAGAGLLSKALEGVVDEFYIYNRALTNAEINAVKNNASVPTLPVVSGVSTLPSSNSVTVSYSLNANNAATTSIVRYGTVAGTYPNQVNGFSTSANSTVAGSAFITGLLPNTTYHFEVLATNSSGTTTPVYGFFSTTASGGGLADSLLAYFPFENNNNSFDNVHNLTLNSQLPIYNPVFSSGKFGQGIDFGNGGAALTNTSMNAVFNAGSYTVSFWEKRTNNTIPYSTSFELFASHYMRTGSSNTTSGFKITSSNIYADSNMNPAVYFNTWTHYAFVFGNSDAPLGGKFVKTYVNGVLSGTSNGVMSNSDMLDKINNVICIGNGTNANGTINANKAFTGMLDEFYIYNRALSVSDINTLMTNSAGVTPLSNADFNSNNIKMAIYPNPATAILNIQAENEIKSVEIYSLLGQKIMTENQKQINVSGLSNGIYMLRIEDENGAVATSKFVKE